MSRPKTMPCPSIIVGAGLTGLMLASYLGVRGHSVRVYEARARALLVADPDRTRAMSMDLSVRGLRALSEIGLGSQIQPHLRPMRGRCHHQPDGAQLRYAYGAGPHASISTVERSTLHRLLLEHVLELPHVQVYFEHRSKGVSSAGAELHFEAPAGPVVVASADHLVVGCDGIHSRVRAAIEAASGAPFSVASYSHRYKALTLHHHGAGSLDRDAMHVWTHGRHMVVAQPCWDGSFSAAVLAPPATLARLSSPTAIGRFFARSFPTVRPFLAQPVEDLMVHPAGVLRTVSGTRWHAGNLLVVGDAAHGMVPFFGQGMNASFEDARLLTDYLGAWEGNWRHAVACFAAARVGDGNAIARLSHDNYPELRGGSEAENLGVRRALEQHMMHQHRDVYLSFHNLVCFTHLPYARALACKRRQEAMFDRLCAGKRDISDLHWPDVDAALSEHQEFVERAQWGAA